MSIDTSHDTPFTALGEHRAGGRSDVHVVGGGLAGLAAAAIVARAGHSVTVHERRNRLGGRATTDERNGFRFNQGPHAFYRSGAGAAVLGRLGIRPTGRSPQTKTAMMVRGGELFVAPGNTTSLARTRLLGVRDKANLAAVLTRLPKLDPAELADLTVGAWVDQLTDRPRVREVVHTVIRLATYVDAPEHLSAEVAATQLRMGLGDGVLYLDRGWQQLVDRLAATPGVTVEAGEPVNDLDDLADRIDGDVGGPGGAAVIVAAGGPRAVAAITGHPYESGPEATAAVLDLGLAAPPRHPFVLGVDESMYLSDHGLAAEMVPAGRASVSLARYHRVAGSDGAEHEHDTGTDATAHLADRERLRGFATHAGITADQILEERYLHRMTVVSSIATAGSGGLAGRPPVSVPNRPGVFVAGDWVGPRGHLGDAVLASASDAARAAIAHLSRRAALR